MPVPNLLNALDAMNMKQISDRATKTRSIGARTKEEFSYALLLNMAKKGHDVFGSGDLTVSAKGVLEKNVRACASEWNSVCMIADRCETWDKLKAALNADEAFTTPSKSAKTRYPNLIEAIKESGMTSAQIDARANKSCLALCTKDKAGKIEAMCMTAGAHAF